MSESFYTYNLILNPTKIDMLLFNYCGLCAIECKNSYDEHYIRYVSVHAEKYLTEIPNDLIEWDSDIIFNYISETVEINISLDFYGIQLLERKMKELGFNS